MKYPLHDKHYGSIVLDCHKDTLELSKSRCVKLDFVKIEERYDHYTSTHLATLKFVMRSKIQLRYLYQPPDL